MRKPGYPSICYPPRQPCARRNLICKLSLKDYPCFESSSGVWERMSLIPSFSDFPAFEIRKDESSQKLRQIDPDDVRTLLPRRFTSTFIALPMHPEEICERDQSVRVTGSGRCGFSAADKWNLCPILRAIPKYLICNGDEGDPGASWIAQFLSDPHSVLEGMIMQPMRLELSRVPLCPAAEYPLAAKRSKEPFVKPKHRICWEMISWKLLQF